MKILKTITFALALLLLPAVSVDAQKRRALNVTDTNAAIEGIRKVMRNTMYQGDNLQAFLDDLCAKKKDDPVLLAGIAKAFFYDSGVKDTTNAFVYINKALAVKPNYAPAYLLKGDILFLDEDTTSALACYNKAIQADSTYIPAYDKVILINRFKDRDKTIALIKSIKNHVPTYPVNLKIADTYVSSTRGSDMQIALDHYKIAERDSMKARDFQNEAFLYRTLTELTSGVEKLNAYMKMYEIGSEGLQRYPDNYELLNIALIGSVNSHNNPEIEKRMELDNKAVEFGEKMFSLAGADTLLNSKNYIAYGKALMNKNKYNEAIDIYTRLLNNDKADNDDKSMAISNIGKAYASMGEYEKANDVYKDYIANLEKAGTLRYYDLQTYAQMYESKAEESVGQEQIDAYKKAAEIYGSAAEKFFEYAGLGYYYQIVALKKIDTENSLGLAVEPCKKLYNLTLAKGKDSENYGAFMQTSLLYLINYNLKIKNYKTAKAWALKYLDVEPDNEGIQDLIRKLK